MRRAEGGNRMGWRGWREDESCYELLTSLRSGRSCDQASDILCNCKTCVTMKFDLVQTWCQHRVTFMSMSC